MIAPIMLTSFSLENYRAFLEKTTVELRPLTLLFGYNNVGKSALIRALALMADAARSSGRGVLDLASDAARECDFDDLLSRSSGREKLRLGLSFQEGENIEVEIAQDLRGKRLFVSDLRISQEPSPPEGPSLVSAQWIPVGPSGETPGYELFVDDCPAGKTELRFTSLAPTKLDVWPHQAADKNGIDEQNTRHEAANEMFVRAARRVDNMGRHFQWLGSLRRYPPRYGRYLGDPPPRMGPDGAGAAEILAYDKLDGGTLLTEVSGWYERCFKRRIDVDQSSDKRFSITLEPIDVATKRQVNIADTGEGMAQVLPVLVAAAMARQRHPWDRWTLAIEQPELHLHPAVHAPLAEHFCEIAAMDNPPRMLIETHSENFWDGFYRLRLRALENLEMSFVRRLGLLSHFPMLAALRGQIRRELLDLEAARDALQAKASPAAGFESSARQILHLITSSGYLISNESVTFIRNQHDEKWTLHDVEAVIAIFGEFLRQTD